MHQKIDKCNGKIYALSTISIKQQQINKILMDTQEEHGKDLSQLQVHNSETQVILTGVPIHSLGVERKYQQRNLYTYLCAHYGNILSRDWLFRNIKSINIQRTPRPQANRTLSSCIFIDLYSNYSVYTLLSCNQIDNVGIRFKKATAPRLRPNLEETQRIRKAIWDAKSIKTRSELVY